MTYKEWIEETKKVLNQLNEGAITEREAFNYIVARASEVEMITPVEGDIDYIPTEL